MRGPDFGFRLTSIKTWIPDQVRDDKKRVRDDKKRVRDDKKRVWDDKKESLGCPLPVTPHLMRGPVFGFGSTSTKTWIPDQVRYDKKRIRDDKKRVWDDKKSVRDDKKKSLG
jgi:hypothetical protein